MTQFLLNEMYRCLQGEGFNIGKPSVLVRFQICNLRCIWCDTPQAQMRRMKGVEAKSLSLDDVVSEINRVSLESSIPIRHAIFSGGEPTIHPIHLIRRVLGDEWSVEVETNGTRIPHREFTEFLESDYSLFQWNISPKGIAAGEEIVPEALEYWGELCKTHPKVFLKCVVRRGFAREDLAEIASWELRYSFPRDRIFLMPEGTTRESQTDAKWLHDICIDKGYRLAPRLHVVLFGNQKGV